MHTDGYAGFGRLARAGPVREVACLAHVRRKFFDVHAAQGSAIAAEALERLAALYAIEKEARGQPPDRRVAIRGAKAGPRLDDLERWLQTQLPRVSAKTPLAAAIWYALTRLKRLRPYLAHPAGHAQADFGEAWAVIGGATRKVRQRDKRLLQAQAPRMYIIPHRRIAAIKATFLTQPIIDPLNRMALLLRHPARHGCFRRRQGSCERRARDSLNAVVFRHGNVRFHFFSNEGSPREPVHIYAETSDGETKSGYIRTCRLPGARTGSPFEVLLARRARVSASAMTDSTSIATRAR